MACRLADAKPLFEPIRALGRQFSEILTKIPTFLLKEKRIWKMHFRENGGHSVSASTMWRTLFSRVGAVHKISGICELINFLRLSLWNSQLITLRYRESHEDHAKWCEFYGILFWFNNDGLSHILQDSSTDVKQQNMKNMDNLALVYKQNKS